MPKTATITSGFTLLQMAIAVLIISLIIGGILVGQSLITNAKLQGILSDIDMYTKAAQTFRDKYKYLPGDFPNAQTFWGTATSCPIEGYTTSPRTATCNGDGNGHIGDHWLGAGSGEAEIFTAWQQLADAGLIKGGYCGSTGVGGMVEARPKYNVPASTYEPGGFTLLYKQPSNLAGDPKYYFANYGHMIAVGAMASGDFTERALLLPGEAYLLDTKVDDGLPAGGQVLAGKSTLMPNCTTSDTASSAQYNATYKSRACALFFITGL